MQSKQYFTKIKNYPHEKSTEPASHRTAVPLQANTCASSSTDFFVDKTKRHFASVCER